MPSTSPPPRPGWRAYARAAVPRRAHYLVLGSGGVTEYTGPDFRPLTEPDLALVEASRPGFAGVADALLRSGHRGTMLVSDGRVACLQFRFINEQSRTVRAPYFPIRPQEVWLHRGWVHPEHRGQRLLQAIVDFDRWTDDDMRFEPRFVANVLADNTPAVKSCLASGMAVEGRFDAWQWIRYQVGRRRDDAVTSPHA